MIVLLRFVPWDVPPSVVVLKYSDMRWASVHDVPVGYYSFIPPAKSPRCRMRMNWRCCNARTIIGIARLRTHGKSALPTRWDFASPRQPWPFVASPSCALPSLPGGKTVSWSAPDCCEGARTKEDGYSRLCRSTAALHRLRCPQLHEEVSVWRRSAHLGPST